MHTQTSPHLRSLREFPSAGDLMSCEGSCMRAFHFGVEADEGIFADDACNPIAMPTDLAQRLSVSLLDGAFNEAVRSCKLRQYDRCNVHLQGSSDPFICPNCLSSVHQCFSCKKEGKAASSHPITDQNVVR